MTKTVRLNDLQLVLLSNAAARDNGSLVPLPASCAHDSDRIGKAVTALLRREFVEEVPVVERDLCWREEDQDMIGLFITDAGRAAIGADGCESASDEAVVIGGDDNEQPAEVQSGATISLDTAPAPSPRPASKIATVVELLQREQGATLDEMVEATGWSPHTTRAALTGLRKKGHSIEKTRRGDVTCYRIGAEA